MKIKSACVYTLFILALVPLTSNPVAAQKNKITVTITDEQNRPVADAKVTLYDLQARKRMDGKTDKKGTETFKNLPDSVFIVVARKDGYDPAYQDNISLRGGVEERIALVFKPGDASKKLIFEDPEMQKKAYDLLLAGIEELKANKVKEAIQKLSESAQINPGSPDVHFNLALAYARNSQWQEAEKSLDEALKLAPNEPRYQQVKQMFPSLVLNAQGQEAMQKRDFKKAIEIFTKLQQMQPNEPEIYYNLALAYANDRQYDKATELAEKATELAEKAVQANPNDALLKQLQADVKQLKEAIAQHKQRDKAADFKALFDEGNQLMQAGRYQEAIAKYEEAKKLFPNEPALYVNSARAYAQSKDTDRALAEYKKLLEVAPNKPEYKRELGEFYLKIGRVDEGLAVYEDYFKQAGTSADQGFFALGQQFSRANKAEEARIAFEKVLQVNPEYAEAYYELGILHYMKDNKKSEEYLSKYVKIGQNKDHLNNAQSLLVVLRRAPKTAPKRQ